MRYGSSSILGRMVGVIAALVVAGLLYKLIAGLLTSILPPALLQALGTGWQMLYGLAGPAVPAIAAMIILIALIWIFIGKGR